MRLTFEIWPYINSSFAFEGKPVLRMTMEIWAEAEVVKWHCTVNVAQSHRFASVVFARTEAHVIRLTDGKEQWGGGMAVGWAGKMSMHSTAQHMQPSLIGP